MKYYASDNNSGAHPDVLKAVLAANEGNVGSYGSDPYTRKAEDLFKQMFGADTRAYFVFLGTAANVLALKASLKPHEGVICASCGHINTDECGAIESVGRKIFPVPHQNGKIRPSDCAEYFRHDAGAHRVLPRIVSITQSTELGILYSNDEVRALSEFCREHKLYLHMDGARIANAAAALGQDFRAITKDLGVDIMSFGGTKNGLMFGEAVLVFNPALAQDFDFYRKQGMQLGSKMRYISAQFITYLESGLWLKNATQANAMAKLLAEKMQAMPGVKITTPVQVNAVFARVPEQAAQKLLRDFSIAMWDEGPDATEPLVKGPELRFMTSFNTTREDIEELAAALSKAL
ncbi:MAG: low specificity L-threonine aldolase [Deltaproteobacteria bacterium]|jgi:threonine aldolase|nr:low specificity L-threonine aldolase [Deltaproteobacteria bacterium]